MNILQGTTPTLTLAIEDSDFTVADITELELTLSNNGTEHIYHISDVELDPSNNAILYHFTEAETMALVPNKRLWYQLRFQFGDGAIVGTTAAFLNIDNLISQELMTE